MFVQKIGSLNKTRFGINFKVEDIKCELNKKENKNNINKDIKNKFK